MPRMSCNFLKPHPEALKPLLCADQQRTKETDTFNITGSAANFSYDFAAAGCACGLEVDVLPGGFSVLFMFFRGFLVLFLFLEVSGFS